MMTKQQIGYEEIGIDSVPKSEFMQDEEGNCLFEAIDELIEKTKNEVKTIKDVEPTGHKRFEWIVNKKHELMNNLSEEKLGKEAYKLEVENITAWFWREVNALVLSNQENGKK